MDYTLIVFGLVSLVVVSVIAYYSGLSSARSEIKESSPRDVKPDTLYLNQRINELQSQVRNLNELNSRYLAFILNISSIVQRLNMTLSPHEIISSITRLVKDVIFTDEVEIYILEKGTDLLKKYSVQGQTLSEEGVSIPMGEGLVGMAAQEGTIRIKGRGSMSSSGQKNRQEDHLSMAAPIKFKDRLFGVIGIGRIKETLGNESQIMKIIADIAGVALLSRSLLGNAQYEADTDPLTGLNNRRYFFQMAQIQVEKSIREGSPPISIFLFDIDNFKHYNDTNGHDAGDRLLKELSSLIVESTRNYCVVARYGGEEFIVMLPGIAKEEALIYAERLAEKIASHPFPSREMQPLGCISVSGGVATFPTDGGSINRVIKLADIALYSAKSDGRNRVYIHKPHLFSNADMPGEDENGINHEDQRL